MTKSYQLLNMALLFGGVLILIGLIHPLLTRTRVASTPNSKLELGLGGVLILIGAIFTWQPWTDPKQLLVLAVTISVFGIVVGIVGFYRYTHGNERTGGSWMIIGSGISLLGLLIPQLIPR